MQNASSYQRLIEEKERIVEVEEEARKKLARDLHDGPTQSVAAIAMRANFIRRLLEREPKSAAEEIYKLEELARKTTKEISAHALHAASSYTGVARVELPRCNRWQIRCARTLIRM